MKQENLSFLRVMPFALFAISPFIFLGLWFKYSSPIFGIAAVVMTLVVIGFSGKDDCPSADIH